MSRLRERRRARAPGRFVRGGWIAGGASAVILLAVATYAPAQQGARQVASSNPLTLLPDGEVKRSFIIDCTGCHVMSREHVFPGGRARSEDEWRTIVARMVGMAGATTPFPVISAARDPAATASWLTRYWGAPPAASGASTVPPAGRFAVQEFMYPHPQDLPHDVAVEADGRVLVTGMFTDAIRRLDPTTGSWEAFPIPVPRANPRALEIDSTGNWWVLLGAAHRIARYAPAAAQWDSWTIPFYGHSIRVGGDGRVWVNGHFTKEPELVVALDPAAGTIQSFEIPNDSALRAGAGPMPYGLRVARDGMVWGTELQGGRLFRLDPASRAVRAWPLPTSRSGPRRPAVASDGAVWIPEYANNRIARFDPASGTFHEWELPVADALPYVVTLDEPRGRVWVGTGAADAVLLFEPRQERWTVVPLSTGALVRHMAVDGRNGELWVAYGASPGIPARIARVRDSTAQ